jgi:hypothetical protein
MFISVIHRISDPDMFWATAASAAKDIPADIRLHQTATNSDRATAICLWEAASVDGVRGLLEPLFGQACKNAMVHNPRALQVAP